MLGSAYQWVWSILSWSTYIKQKYQFLVIFLDVEKESEIIEGEIKNNIHIFTGCVWNSSFIQPETGTIRGGLARGK